MSEHIRKTIEEVQIQVRDLEAEITRKKRMVNDLAELAGQPKVYSVVENEDKPSISSIRRDQWYGQPLSTAIRGYMELRRAANLGPAKVAEIFQALTDGGFKFETKDDENARRGLRISLTKNTTIFHRLPDGKHYGLLEWYPEAKAKKGKANSDDGGSAESPPESTNGDEEVERY